MRHLRPAGAQREAGKRLFSVHREIVQLPLMCLVLVNAKERGEPAAMRYWAQLTESQRAAVVRRAGSLQQAVRQNMLDLRHVKRATPAQHARWKQRPPGERLPDVPAGRHHQAALGHITVAATVRQDGEGRCLVQQVCVCVYIVERGRPGGRMVANAQARMRPAPSRCASACPLSTSARNFSSLPVEPQLVQADAVRYAERIAAEADRWRHRGGSDAEQLFAELCNPRGQFADVVSALAAALDAASDNCQRRLEGLIAAAHVIASMEEAQAARLKHWTCNYWHPITSSHGGKKGGAVPSELKANAGGMCDSRCMICSTCFHVLSSPRVDACTAARPRKSLPSCPPFVRAGSSSCQMAWLAPHVYFQPMCCCSPCTAAIAPSDSPEMRAWHDLLAGDDAYKASGRNAWASARAIVSNKSRTGEQPAMGGARGHVRLGTTCIVAAPACLAVRAIWRCRWCTVGWVVATWRACGGGWRALQQLGLDTRSAAFVTVSISVLQCCPWRRLPVRGLRVHRLCEDHQHLHGDGGHQGPCAWAPVGRRDPVAGMLCGAHG